MKKIKGEIVDEYLKRYPNEFKKTLARIICEERPDIFSSVDDVRRMIRYRTGSAGVKARNQTGLKKKEIDMKELMSKYYLRAEENKETADFILPDSYKRIGVISDVHFPYHSEKALTIALQYLYDQGIDCLYINGDLLDFYQISRWSKDPSRASMAYEINMCIEFWEMLRHMWPDIPIYFKLGNHEARFEDYMRNKAKELLGISDFEFQSFMKLEEYKITMVGSKQKTKYRTLNIAHGHEFGRSIFNPVNPARGLFLRAKASGLVGHHHQSSEYNEKNLNKDSIACWSTGCLCDLSPSYAPTAYLKWNHGFALISGLEDGSYVVDNLKIIGGQVR